MKNAVLVIVLLFTTSCATGAKKADRVDIQRCSQLLGDGWALSEPPALESELLAMASFNNQPLGFAWYSSVPGTYAACAMPQDRDDCTYEIHEYREQIHRMWSYLSGAVRKFDCTERS